MVMKPFQDWWKEVQQSMNEPRIIRNWTAKEGYSITGKFVALSYARLKPEIQAALNNGYPFSQPDHWIVCSQVKGENWTRASRKEFEDRYWKWIDYRNDGMTRKHFSEPGNASPYLISIFKEFNSLI
jgi:hypothetical protein